MNSLDERGSQGYGSGTAYPATRAFRRHGVLEAGEGQTRFHLSLLSRVSTLCYLSQQLGGGRRPKPGCAARDSCWPPVTLTHSAAVLGVFLPPSL